MCHGRASRSRPFVQTPYVPDADGCFHAVLPQRCPFAAEDGVRTCDLRIRHLRARTTGPCFALTVVRCSTHPVRAFTLYPPGHVPYGRVAVTPSSASGTLLLDADTDKPAWELTLFQAVEAAAREERWADDSPAGDPRRRRTQGRWLEAAGLLTGVHPQQADAVREQLATRLGVATMTLRGAVKMSASASSWTTRADAVLLVTREARVTAGLADRLLVAGCLAGLWPPPLRWDPRTATLLDLFRRPASPPSRATQARAPPCTNPPEASFG